MAIDFAESALFGKRRSTQQFDIELKDILLVQFDFAGAGLETAYTVTTGKTFFINAMFLVNASGSAQTWDIRFDDKKVFEKAIAASDTAQVDYQSPVALTTGKTIKGISGDGANQLMIIGWEV
jgi:hypothetical protein|tara:strand:- start:878 stop:1246 length:369 start_codon:yes stop_codon:yes gene_type:complete